jgi:hypothetical protein
MLTTSILGPVLSETLAAPVAFANALAATSVVIG